jgi:hypothetical protein
MATVTERGTGQSFANVTKNLKGVDFPAGRQELVRLARQLHAEQIVIDQIQKLDDREYESMSDVITALGEAEGQTSIRSSASQRVQPEKQGKSQVKPTHHR